MTRMAEVARKIRQAVADSPQNYWRSEALTSQRRIEKVLAVHKRGYIDALYLPDCINEDCEHENGCPSKVIAVCQGCYDFGEECDPYFCEETIPQCVEWPCRVARILTEDEK